MPFRLTHEAISGGADTSINFGPAEIIIDVPQSMGCYKILDTFTSNTITSQTFASLSPARCITYCLGLDERKRFAGS